jgi:hypothetical protein
MSPQVKEPELLAMVYSLQQLDYMDDQIIGSLEKVLRLRGCQIQEPDLVATICEACCHFRIRSPTLLEVSHRNLSMNRKGTYILADIHGMDHFCPKLAPQPI